MASHFDCIGIAGDRASVVGILDDLVLHGHTRPRADGGELVIWTDPSGARMAVNLSDEGDVLCVTPSFDGQSRVSMNALDVAEDPQCVFCDRLVVEVRDGDGEMLFPLALQIDDLGTSRESLSLGPRLEARVAAFAHDIRAWPDEAAYAASARPHRARLAAESFVPRGMFAPDGSPTDPPEAEAIFTGRVIETEVRQNTLTGLPFRYLLVRTYGASLDVLAPARALPASLATGHIVQGSFWIVGRVLQPASLAHSGGPAR